MPQLAAGPHAFVGIDVGGSKTAAALVDQEMSVFGRRARATKASLGQPAVLNMLCGLVKHLVARAAEMGLSVRGVGVATTGIVDATRGVVTAATEVLPGWSEVPLRDKLELATGMNVVVLNDVRAMALAKAAKIKLGTSSMSFI